MLLVQSPMALYKSPKEMYYKSTKQIYSLPWRYTVHYEEIQPTTKLSCLPWDVKSTRQLYNLKRGCSAVEVAVRVVSALAAGGVEIICTLLPCDSVLLVLQQLLALQQCQEDVAVVSCHTLAS